MKTFLRIIFVFVLFLAFNDGSLVYAAGESTHKPFPQHTSYYEGVIKPNNVTQAEMDHEVMGFYEEWKIKYLKQHPIKGYQYYVAYDEVGNTVSEAHGYGMLITVMMAGYDDYAKEYFDGLFRYYRAHPSEINSALMSWKQNRSESDMLDESPVDSATDGDLDIAYALLLADKQWGSLGAINYLSEANKMIAAIMESDINQTDMTIKLGDWATSSSPEFYTATRSSDWMLNHLKAFEHASGDPRWTKVVDKTYTIVNDINSNYSNNTGLMPDFILKKSGAYVPSYSNFLESPYDGMYNWNASRTPWRLATDYIMTGDERARNALIKTNKWIQKASDWNPANIYAGYKLDGTPIDTNVRNQMAYVAPLAVSAMVDPSDQEWLNVLWTHIVATPSQNYYNDSVKLLSMFVISGNWWTSYGENNLNIE